MDIMHQYVVKQGDTLWKLSKAWGVPLADMIKANPQLKNPNVLMTGEIVNVPKAGHMTTTPTTGAGTTGAGTTAAGTGGHAGHHALHPLSVMSGTAMGWRKKTDRANTWQNVDCASNRKNANRSYCEDANCANNEDANRSHCDAYIAGGSTCATAKTKTAAN